MRDALSILDQAIAHGAGKVEAATVQDMLGLADRTRIVDLFEHVMRGDAARGARRDAGAARAGADPAVVLTDLAEFTPLRDAPEACAGRREPGGRLGDGAGARRRVRRDAVASACCRAPGRCC